MTRTETPASATKSGTLWGTNPPNNDQTNNTLGTTNFGQPQPYSSHPKQRHSKHHQLPQTNPGALWGANPHNNGQASSTSDNTKFDQPYATHKSNKILFRDSKNCNTQQGQQNKNNVNPLKIGIGVSSCCFIATISALFIHSYYKFQNIIIAEQALSAAEYLIPMFLISSIINLLYCIYTVENPNSKHNIDQIQQHQKEGKNFT